MGRARSKIDLVSREKSCALRQRENWGISFCVKSRTSVGLPYTSSVESHRIFHSKWGNNFQV